MHTITIPIKSDWEMEFTQIAKQLLYNTSAGVFTEESNVIINDCNDDREFEITFTYPDINGRASIHVHPYGYLESWDPCDVVTEFTDWLNSNVSLKATYKLTYKGQHHDRK